MGRRLVRLPDDVQQRARRAAAAVEVREQLLDAASEPLEAARDDLELVPGYVRVKGSPEKAVTIAALAAEATFNGKGSGRSRVASRAGGAMHRPPGARVVPRAAADHARGARPGRPRDRRRPRAAGRGGARLRPVLNRVGADGQVYGGVVMGIGQALSEGTQLDGQGRQRNPHLLDYKLVTASDAPEIAIDWVETRYAERRPEGLEGRRRAALRPDRRSDRERDRQVVGNAGPAAADDARARLGGAAGVKATAPSRPRRTRRGARGARRRRATGCGRHRSRRRRPPGQGAAARRARRDPPRRRIARDRGDADGLRLGALVTPRRSPRSRLSASR